MPGPWEGIVGRLIEINLKTRFLHRLSNDGVGYRLAVVRTEVRVTCAILDVPHHHRIVL